jgi:hypothetical protein
MSGAFERLARSVLRHLGQDAFLLRGAVSTPCRVNVERGVQVSGQYDDAVFTRDVATIDKKVGAKVGDILNHPLGVFLLDGLVLDNGYTARFSLQPTVLPAPEPGP